MRKGKFYLLYQQIMESLILQNKATKIARMKKIWPESSQDEIQKAAQYAQRFNIDLQKYHSAEELIQFIQKQKAGKLEKNQAKNLAKKQKLNPDKIPEFFNRVDQGDGVVTYWVKDDKDGQKAIRRFVDQELGVESNPWCLITRKDSILKRRADQISQMTDDQKQKLGLFSNDQLETAFKYWKQYGRYPKRVAFKNGHILALCARMTKYTQPKITWWDLKNHATEEIPGTNITILTDKDKNFQKVEGRKHKKLDFIKNGNLSDQQIAKIINGKNVFHKIELTKNQNLKLSKQDIIKLITDKNRDLKCAAIENIKSMPDDLLQELINSDDKYDRMSVANRKNLSNNQIQKLVNDESFWVREAIAGYKNLQEKFMLKLVNDEQPDVRKQLIERGDLPENIIQALSNDEDEWVKIELTKYPNLSKNIIQKLSNDEDWSVRQFLACRSDLPQQVMQKLANDEVDLVRQSFYEYHKDFRKS